MKYKLRDLAFPLFSLFIFILVPVTKLNSTFDMGLAPRFFILSVFTFISAIILIVYGRKYFYFDGPTRRIFLAGLLIIVWTGLAMIMSINSGDAFGEWLRISILYLFFFIAFQLIKDNPAAPMLACRGAAISVLILCVFAVFNIVDAFNDPFRMTNASITNNFVASFGNKNFFSEVLVMLLPFLMYGLKDRKWRPLFISSLILTISFIIILQTISAWIGIIVSILFLLILTRVLKLNFFRIKITGKKLAAYLLFLIIILSIGFKFYKNSGNYKLLVVKIKSTKDYIFNPALLQTTSESNVNSVFERLLVWKNSFEMIGDHPLFGVGLNNWKIYNPLYGMTGTSYINSGMISYEHPHNDYLLIWAEQGPVGLILYLLLIVLIIRSGIRVLKTSSENKLFILLLIGGVIAFCMMSMFGYPRSRMYVMILLMLSYAFIVSASVKEEVGKNKLRLIIPGILIIIISIFGIIASYYKVTGEINMKKTVRAQVSNNFAKMMWETDKINLWYFPLDLTNTPVNWYRGMALFYSKNIPGAIEEYERALKINPNHLRVINDLATSYEQAGERKKAIQLYRKSLEMTPQFIEGILNISASYYNMNNIDSAFYFIDKLFSVPMDRKDTSNYNKFLDAIIYAKANNAISEIKDTGVTNKFLTLIEGKNFLINVYKKSKVKKESFAKYLICCADTTGK